MIENDNILKFSEYLENNDIWQAIADIEPFSFINPTFQTMQSFNYGNRTMFKMVNELPVDTVAQMIVSKYKSKWDALVDTAIININASEATETKEVLTSSKDLNGTGSNTNKVSGYNTDDLIVDTGTDTTSANNENLDSTKTTTISKLNNSALFDNLNYIDKTNIITVVQKDVTNYLTLTLY